MRKRIYLINIIFVVVVCFVILTCVNLLVGKNTDEKTKIVLENVIANADKDKLYQEYLVDILEERIKEFENIQDCNIFLKLDEDTIDEVEIFVVCVEALDNEQRDDIKEMAADIFQISTDSINVNSQ